MGEVFSSGTMRSPGAPLAVGVPIARTAASTSGMRNKPLREGERLIEFVIDGIFIFWRLVLWFTDVLRELRSEVWKNLSEFQTFPPGRSGRVRKHPGDSGGNCYYSKRAGRRALLYLSIVREAGCWILRAG